ncbi:MAG: MFS transporter, partial [Acetobacteraceae bacterium]|nr:MFS transporter [Acetobacteraceae bacterium]
MPGKARNLALLAAAQVLVLSVWFAGTAALPALLAEGAVAPARGGLLTTAVQLGFVAGTLVSALLTLADRVPARLLCCLCSIVAGLATIGMALVPPAGAADRKS